MYLIYGEEQFLINQKINKLKSKYNDNQIILLDENYSYDDLLKSLSATNLFNLKQLIIVKGLDLFKLKKLDTKQNKISEILIRTLSNYDDNEVVFVANEKKIADNNFTSQFLKLNNCQILEMQKISKKQLPEQIMQYITSKKGNISYIDLLYLLEKIPDDLGLIIKEVDKLLLVNPNINKTIIDENISHYPIPSAFGFVNSLQKGNFVEIYNAYLNQKQLGETTIQLISQVSWSFVLVYQVACLLNLNMSQKDIADFLKINEYRVKLANIQLNKYGISRVKKIIQNLALVDLETKSSSIDSYLIFEQFLIDNFLDLK
ncbi:DNA polymerase III subunit delta [Mycoplasma hafezii]|uniref:DNA polymerase III subunit delta n=1 Tax=Mycoplasma hafezii TaxID=525886 RepID=UPI003CF1A074